MTNQEIKAGDVVVIKSGGPQMTVMRMAGGAPVCRWFHKGEVKEAVFKHGTLFLAKDHPKLVEGK